MRRTDRASSGNGAGTVSKPLARWRRIRVALALFVLWANLVLGAQVSTAAPVPATQMCGQSQPSSLKTGLSEVRGFAIHGVKLWALLFYQPPAVAGADLKIVVRVTGSGPFHIKAVGPEGQTVKHTWMEYHSGSNWNRPGDEWGTGWQLPTAGCWHLHVTRRSTSGNIWLAVVPGP
jgi:hypothetical protein